MTASMWPWILFTVFVLGMLAFDLGVFHRDAHVVTKKEAALLSLVWILLPLTFNAGSTYAVEVSTTLATTQRLDSQTA